MLRKVSTKEIKAIKERLKAELGDRFLPFQRKEEIMSLIYHLDTWLDGRDYQERGQIQSESGI